MGTDITGKHLSLVINPQGDEASIPLQPMVHTPSSPTVQYYQSIFDRADRDHDGFITPNELSQMIIDNNLTDEPLSTFLVKRIHRLADANHDDRLDFNEFVNMLTNPKFKSIFGQYVTKYIEFIVPRKRLGDVPDFEDPNDILYEDQYSCCPPKLGMIIISIIELTFFLIDEFNEKNSTNFATGPMAQIFIYDPKKREEAWRYITYMFVHIGYLHLTVNLVVQIFIGIPLEMVHSWYRVLIVYFAGVIAGSLGTSIADPSSKLAGASGGVYSLITAHIATIILNWREMSFPAVQLLIFLMITGIDVGTSIYNRYYTQTEDHIGYIAHFAGALAGLLVGIFVLKNLKLTKKENYIWWFALAVYAILMAIGVCWNIFYSDYFGK